MNCLFCYFTGNEPENESVHFAVSKDGYNFTALNKNEPVIIQTLGKKCMRDPYLFRDEKGVFHIIATDMRSFDGWCSNNSMVMWDSDDLICWKNERIFDFSLFEETKTADRVWAPQVFYDKIKDEYMIYWSNHNKSDDLSTVIWYIYTKDFQSFTTRPKLLFAPKSGLAGIDGDIIEKDGRFYLFEADEAKDGICYAVSDKLDGEYFEPDGNKISVCVVPLEGGCIYYNENSNKYILIADRFRNGGYFMQESDDLVNYTEVPNDKFSLDHLKPRHGSMIKISDEELNRLLEHFGS